MVKKFSKNNLNKKRGISTIIGGMIFLILLTAGFSTFFLAMDVQSDTINAQLSVSDSVIRKTQEQFDIAIATDDSSSYLLDIQVKNKGPNPVEISDIWIVNKSLANQPALKIAVNYSDAFIPSGYSSSILENQRLTMVLGDYDIKVISTLGTIQKSELKVGGVNYLQAEMYAFPADVRKGENVTLALRITNIGPTTIKNVQPLFTPPDIGATPPVWIDTSQLVSPSSYDLDPDETVIFAWHTRLSIAGTEGAKIEFTDSVTGIESTTGFSVSSNSASDKIIIRVDEGGGGDLIVLAQELLSRPDIFIISPSPWGGGENSVDDHGVWGVNVANPTIAPMDVSKVTLTILPPGAQNNDKVFDTSCDPQTIQPTTGPPPEGFWACPTENQLTWKVTNPADRVTIDPYSVQSFLVNVEAGRNLVDDLESMIVHTSVFTTVGAFGKAGYESSMNGTPDSLINVYLSTVDNSTANTDIKSTRVGMLEGSTQFFKIVLADMDDRAATFIDPTTTNAHLIINVPKDWKNVQLVDNHGGFVKTPPPSVVQWVADGSWQIIGTLAPGNTVGDTVNDAVTLEFSAEAPDVTGTQMYVMYVLADGLTDDGFSIGPLAEIVLQVIE